MMSINIPNRVLPGFEVLLNLNKTEFGKILDYLKNIEIKDSFDKISSDINDLSGKNNGFELFKTILSFSQLVQKKDNDVEIDIKEVAKGLTESFINTNQSFNDGVLLENRLHSILLDYDKIQHCIFIKEITSSNENNFVESNVITDIRPVINENIIAKKRYSMILHKLTLEYQSNSEFKEIQLTLDLQDLNKLKNVIDKALSNEETIKADYSKNFEFLK